MFRLSSRTSSARFPNQRQTVKLASPLRRAKSCQSLANVLSRLAAEAAEAEGLAGAVATTVVVVEDLPAVVDSEGVVVTTVAAVAVAAADSVDEAVEAVALVGEAVDIRMYGSLQKAERSRA
jgi:hypothetical protein